MNVLTKKCLIGIIVGTSLIGGLCVLNKQHNLMQYLTINTQEEAQIDEEKKDEELSEIGDEDADSSDTESEEKEIIEIDNAPTDQPKILGTQEE